jgi:hypothetical protein
MATVTTSQTKLMTADEFFDFGDITVYRTGREPLIFSESDEITGEDVLPELRLRVTDFFKMPGE